MKLPRSLSGEELVKALRKIGYETSRQSGSHIRLNSKNEPPHHITVPNHDYLRVGTLSAIISDVAEHLDTSKEEIAKKLFSQALFVNRVDRISADGVSLSLPFVSL